MLPSRPDDLNDLERRLAGCEPAREGLDADAMLFAAGRAAARRGRVFWPALAASLMVVAVALGTWAVSERAERVALAEQLRLLPAPPGAPQPDSGADTVPPSTDPAADSLLMARRAAEVGIEGWPSRTVPSDGPADPPRPILRAGQRDAFLSP